MDGIEIGTLEDDGTTLVLRRHVALPVEQVWSHVADSDRLAGWYGTYTGDPTSGAVMVTLNAESDAADPVRYDVHACERPSHLSVSTTNDYGRWALGLDLGSQRIGVALSDSDATLALPYDVVVRTGDRDRDHRRIADIVAETGAEVVVVGLPLSLDGGEGPMARRYRAEARRIGATLGVPVETYDERLTTVTAERALRESGLSGRARRRVVDQVAASVMLQSWLDRRAARGEEPPE